MSDATGVINRPPASPTPSAPAVKAAKPRRRWKLLTAIAAIALVVGGVVGSFVTATVMTKTPVVPALTQDLLDRGFTNVNRVEGDGESRTVSIPGYKPECRFLVQSDGAGGWTLTVPSSSAGQGTFEYPNPNAPQFAAKFPEQLAGCELGEKPSS